MVSMLARVLIAGFLAMSGLVLATSAPAFACKCQVADTDQQTQRADAVFVGTVDSVTEDAAGKQFEYAVTAKRSYKGTVERETTVVSNQATAACGLGELKVGTEYVFLVAGDTPPFTASSCGGSGTATATRVADVEAALGAGTAIEQPAPPAPTMTRLEESAPASVSRLAAPGGALVLVGLLGLLVVGRLARR